MTKPVVILCNVDTHRGDRFLKEFDAGLRANKLETQWVWYSESILKFFKPSETFDGQLVVVWGIEFRKLLAHRKASNQSTIVLEYGYFGDRTSTMISVGLDDLKGRGKYHTTGVLADRWEMYKDRLKLVVKPWRNVQGRFNLIVGQVLTDDAVKDHINMQNWYDDVAFKLGNISKLPTLFRRHPMEPVDENSFIAVCPFQPKEIFQQGNCAITFNSNFAVDAMFQGLPMIAQDPGSMLYDIADRELRCVDNPTTFDREPVLHELAYKQWHIREMREGRAFESLNARAKLL